jgi:hypothetical protein
MRRRDRQLIQELRQIFRETGEQCSASEKRIIRNMLVIIAFILTSGYLLTSLLPPNGYTLSALGLILVGSWLVGNHLNRKVYREEEQDDD